MRQGVSAKLVVPLEPSVGQQQDTEVLHYTGFELQLGFITSFRMTI
jgi:hypothetical protein